MDALSTCIEQWRTRENAMLCNEIVLEGLLATAVTIDVRYEYLLTFPIPLPLLVTLF